MSIVSGQVVFTPTANYNGAASFDYTVQDNGQSNGSNDFKTDTGHVSFTITPVNDAPVASDDTLSSIAEDSGSRTISFASLTGNDSKGPADESGQSLTITGVSNAIGGTVSIVSGQVVFTPTANYNGTASFDYTVQDNGQSNGSNDFKTDTGHASFTITAVNDAPVASDDTLSSVAEDSGSRTISFASLTGNDSKGPTDESGQSLTITGVSNAIGGTVSIVSGQVVFTPTANYNGTASFDYTVQDNGQSNGSNDFKTDTGHASFTITAVNDAPVIAGTLSATVAEGGSHVITVAELGEADPDDSGTGLTYAVTSQSHGSILLNGAAATSFTAQDVIDGHVAFKHDGSEGASASFGFTLADGGENGTTPATGTFGLTVSPVNDGAATLGISGTATQGQTLTANLGADPDGAKTNIVYKWYDDSTLISGATGSAYTLGAGDVGHKISVNVSYTDGQGYAENVTSAQTAAVIGGNHTPVITSVGNGTITEDATSSGNNLVSNPGFESSSFNLTNWTKTGNVGVGAAIFGFTHTGGNGAEMFGTGTLSQTITTVAGQHYTLSFWVANVIEGGAGASLFESGANSFVVNWGGVAVVGSAVSNADYSAVLPSSDPLFGNPAYYGFTQYVFDVVGGAGTSTTLSFAETNDSNYSEWALDDVSVRLVPTESTSGTVKYTDADSTDVHLITVTTPVGSNYVGTFTISPTADSTGGGTGNVNWSFSASDTALQFLAAGQSLLQTYTINIDDQHGGVKTQDVSVTLVGRNDAPVINVGDSTHYALGSAAVAISPSVTISDVDSPNFGGGSLTVRLAAVDNTKEVLSIHNQGIGAGQIGVSGGNVTYGGVTIGSFSIGASGTDELLSVSFNSAATVMAVQALLQDVYYSSTLATNFGGTREALTYTLVDGDGVANGGTDTAVAYANVDLFSPSTVTLTTSTYDNAFFDTGTNLVKATVGTGATFNSNDTLHGGIGIDTIEITNSGTVADSVFQKTTGFEVLHMTGTSGADTVNLGFNAKTAFVDGLTIDHGGLAGSLVVTPGSGSNIYNHDMIVIGGIVADTITTGSGNDTIRGGAGNDTIDGGAGIDLLDLSDATGAISMTLTQSSSSMPLNLSLVGLGSDTYKNIEGVIGSDFNDTITGSSSNDVLIGGKGADVLSGGGGIDTFKYLAGDANATDSILDFTTGSSGDVIDLSGLLASAPGNKADDVRFLYTGGATHLVSDDGTAPPAVDGAVTVQVQLTSGTWTNVATIADTVSNLTVGSEVIKMILDSSGSHNYHV